MDIENFENQPYSHLATIEDIYHCYRLILGRNPDNHGWHALTSMVGNLKIDDLVLIFLTHPEFKNREIFKKMLGDDATLPIVADCRTFKLYASPNDTSIGLGILNSGMHEPHVTHAINRILKPRMVFVDIGANIGYFSLLAAQLVGRNGQVIAFEPSQRNCALLHFSVILNQLSNINIYPFAVAEKDTTVVYNTLLGSNGIISKELMIGTECTNELAHKTLVRAVKLDTILNNIRRIDVIKIDIEGAEYRALAGAQELIRKHQPTIFSEYSPGWLPDISGVSGRDYLLALVKWGYLISILETNGHSIDCGQDVEKVLDYFKENALDHIDLVMYPSKRRGLFHWLNPS